jgi:hypothetical protein
MNNLDRPFLRIIKLSRPPGRLFLYIRPMKIYYEPPDQITEVDEVLESLSERIPEEVSHLFVPMANFTRKIYTDKTIQSFELLKYKVMWALRFIEQDIDNEEGHLLIKNDGGMELIDFSPELTQKIREQMNIHFKK